MRSMILLTLAALLASGSSVAQQDVRGPRKQPGTTMGMGSLCWIDRI